MKESSKTSFDKFQKLKKKAGTHSPSLLTIKNELPEINIKVDACFLSNPYATDLFLKYFKRELLQTGEINRILEFYPSQNSEIAQSVGKFLGMNSSKIFIGNGATEIIQAIMHNFVTDKVVVNIPTFSPYYEFANKETEVVFYNLKKEQNFRLDKSEYISFIEKEKPNSIVLINPNNPDGGYVSQKDITELVEELSWVKNIIIDESFIHFAYENSSMVLPSIEKLASEYSNVYLIKSMSKDFGIAGIRCGYAIMDASKVSSLIQNGFLWNSGGLAEYFFRLYTREDFLLEYEEVRKKYITESLFFTNELNQINNIKVYPTKANFVLVEILDGRSSGEIATQLLIDHGIYVRNCSDKIGLEGEFIRIATRHKDENEYIVGALKSVFG